MRLHLEYARAPHSQPVWMWPLLVVLIAAMVACIWFYADLKAERAGLALKLESGTKAEKPLQPAALSGEQQAALEARAKSAAIVLHELGRPWPELLERLEGAQGERIALLSLNLEGAKGMLRIAGEGRHLVDVLDYMQRLSSDAFLTEVVLDQHEVVENDALKPVRFSLSARWGGA